MSNAERQVVAALISEAVNAWIAGDDNRAEVWCQRAWAHAHGSLAEADEEASR